MKLQVGILFASLLASTFAKHLVAEDFHFRHEHVLGTSMHLAVSCDDKTTALAIEQSVLEEIDRLDTILSRWNGESELMRWKVGRVSTISQDLAAVLKRAEFWRVTSSGAFDVRAQAVTRVWEHAAKHDRVPSDSERQQVTVKMTASPYQWKPNGPIQRVDALPISLDGLAKGYILDQVCELVQRDYPGTHDFLINIGGDLRKLGDQPLEIAIENPKDASEGAQPLQRIVVTQPIAMATSGNYRRSIPMGEKSISHIVDPRTCLPANSTLSVTVLCRSGVDADALATALSVLGPVDGIALIETIENTECCIVTANQDIVTSSGWPLAGLQASADLFVAKDETPKSKYGLFVDFTIQRAPGGRYRRPYVAMWLEDAEGFPIKTEILWLQTEQPGPRWHRDLTRWYRNDRLRRTVENVDLIDTVSGATRGPGEYKAHFDGTDNQGLPLAKGKYTLCLEVAREHGTYQIIRDTFEWDDQPISEKKLKGNAEVGAMSYRFVPQSMKDNEVR